MSLKAFLLYGACLVTSLALACTQRGEVEKPPLTIAEDALPADIAPADGAAEPTPGKLPPGDEPPNPPAEPTPPSEPEVPQIPAVPEVPAPGCEDDPNRPPLAPSLVAPRPGTVGLIPAELVISATAFSDPDADAYATTEIEIWSARDGIARALVWRAAGALGTQARLSDGAFVGAASQLEPWTQYVTHVRYFDTAACPRPSPWSVPTAFRTDDGSAYLFDEAQVRSFWLDIPPASWSAIDAEAMGADCAFAERSYYSATLGFEEQQLKGVGLHVKGGCGSSRSLSGKAAFKVSLAWDDPKVPGCPTERRLYGEQRFTFNNAVQDRTFAHELLGYRYFRALGLPAPRAAHVRLYVNGEYWGLYVHLETIDRRYLKRRFASNRGMLYEGTHACDLVPGNVPASDTDPSCLSPKFSPGACDELEPGDDPMGYAMARELTASIAALPGGGFYPAIESFFDFEAFLTQWAANAVIANWDGYEGSHITNYRVYHDPATRRWTLIQTGIDQTFLWGDDPWEVAAVLATRCLAEPDCEAAFAAHLRAAADTFAALDLASEAARLHERIVPHVTDDPRRAVSMEDFEAAHTALRSWIRDRPASVRARLRAHGF